MRSSNCPSDPALESEEHIVANDESLPGTESRLVITGRYSVLPLIRDS